MPLSKTEIEHVINKWGTKDLKVDIAYYYTPLIVFDIPKENSASKISPADERRTPGSQEDYNLFLSLKTSDYKRQSVADFNYALLKWTTENEEVHQRILEDFAKNDIRVNLTDEELSFLTLTFSISNTQNAIMVRSANSDEPKADLILQFDLRNEEPNVWYWLWYQISIKISDENKLTIGERDKYLSNIINGMRTFWNEKEFEELSTLSEETFRTKLSTLVNQNSNNLIKIEMYDIYFEGLDERSIMNN